ncbi:MAG: hypothetical protein SPG61_01460 [Arcanobacterium sp.]|nr:hypothetical protein [Arcanobacterium sp.]
MLSAPANALEEKYERNFPAECSTTSYCAFLTNTETGKTLVLNSGKITDIDSNTSLFSSEITEADLIKLGTLPEKQYSSRASGSSSTTITPVKLTVGMDYQFKGSQIKISRVFGSLQITNVKLWGTVSNSLLVAQDYITGHTLKRYPQNKPNSKFSYTTNWGWVPFSSGQLGAYALYDATFKIDGMSAKTTMTVKYVPEKAG